MTKTKRTPKTASTTTIPLPPALPSPIASDLADISTVTALLSAEYPLIDAPLIIALVSDYDPSQLVLHLDAIREQLGIIEATLVPDTIDSEPGAALTASEPSLLDELDDRLKEVSLDQPSTSSSAASRARSTASSGSRQESSGSGRKNGASIKSSTTSPTSVHEDDLHDEGFEEEVEYLHSLFPSTSIKTIRQTLISETSVSAAIDHLLSLELIRKVENSGHWPEDSDHDHESRDATWSASTPSSKKSATPSTDGGPRKSRKPVKTTKTIPLVDTLQRRSNASSPRPTSRAPSRTASPGPSSNAWGTVTSLSTYLSEIIPTKPQSYFLAYLHSPKHHSAYSAVRASLQALPKTHKIPDEDSERSQSILEEIFGVSLVNDGWGSQKANAGREEVVQDLQLCVTALGNNVAAVLDLMDLLGEISQWPGDDDLERYDQLSTAVIPQALSDTSVAWSPPPSPKLGSPKLGSPKLLHPAPKAPANPDRLLTKPQANLIKDLKEEKIVVGSRPAPTSFASPTAFDGFGSFAPAGPSKTAKTGKQVHPQNWRTVDHTRQRPSKTLHPYASSIPSYARGATPHDPTPGSLYYISPHQASIDDCLSHASRERAKREEAIRAAGRHFRGMPIAGGKALNATIAGHYASQAREAGELARGWELKAARMIVTDQLDRSGSTIDLHHMTVEEAVTVAKEIAAKWYEKEKTANFGGVQAASVQKQVGFAPARALTVVTGVGRHSAGQRGVLGPAVSNALERDGWRVDRGSNGQGYLVVRGRK